MAVITISSEPGAFGKEIAARLAGRLGFSLVDKVRLAQISGELDLDAAGLRGAEKAISKGSAVIDSETEAGARLVQDFIAQLAEEHDLVVNGRGAQGLFKNRPGTLHVRCVAPLEFRVARIRNLNGLSEREARRQIKTLERERARYLRFLYGLNPADPLLYDFILRTDRLTIDQILNILTAAIDQMNLRQVPKEQIVEHLLPQMPEKRENGRFVNAAEKEFARFLEFYRIPFEYEPHTFTLESDSSGRVIEAFTPDFYLPEQHLYIELTTLKQSLVTRKNRKVRKLRRLYPDINIRIFYQRDFYHLMAKYGLLAGEPAANA